jgi:hypothetical protein
LLDAERLAKRNAKYMKEYGIEAICLDSEDSIKENLITAQARQGRS